MDVETTRPRLEIPPLTHLNSGQITDSTIPGAFCCRPSRARVRRGHCRAADERGHPKCRCDILARSPAIRVIPSACVTAGEREQRFPLCRRLKCSRVDRQHVQLHLANIRDMLNRSRNGIEATMEHHLHVNAYPVGDHPFHRIVQRESVAAEAERSRRRNDSWYGASNELRQASSALRCMKLETLNVFPQLAFVVPASRAAHVHR